MSKMSDISISRSKSVRKNAIIMMFVKGASLLVSFLYIPLLYDAFDTVNYGVWLTLTSLVSWVAMCDIGLGNGLRNKLAESLALGDVASGKKYVSTAYVCIFTIIAVLMLLFCVVCNYIPWSTILNANSIDASVVEQLVIVVFITFCLRFALNLINSVLLAMQLPALSSLIIFVEQILAFFIVWILVRQCETTSIIILGSVISITPVAVLLIASCMLYSTRFRNIAPSIKFVEFSKVRSIVSLGVKFFVLQLGMIILNQSNNLIITHVVGPQAVVDYNIAFRYMNILLMMFNIIATPIWSATTDAYARGDYEWIQVANKKLVRVALMMSAIGAVMLLCSSWFYRLWIGAAYIEMPFSISLWWYLYIVFMMMYGSYGYFINGFGHLRLQMIVTIIQSLIYTIFAVVMGKIFGLDGVLIMFVVTAIVNYIWSKLQYTRIVSKNAVGIWIK